MKKTSKAKSKAVSMTTIASETTDDEEVVVVVVPSSSSSSSDEVLVPPPPPPPQDKRGGRKAKGGKIIQPSSATPLVSSGVAAAIAVPREHKPSIILHLKCWIRDVEHPTVGGIVEPFDDFFLHKNDSLGYEVLEDTCGGFSSSGNGGGGGGGDTSSGTEEENSGRGGGGGGGGVHGTSQRELHKKLKQLEYQLHTNQLAEKKSACFWCTYDFDHPPIHLPKFCLQDVYHVYGCFCSPECGTAFLMNENIDSSTKFERYHLLNHIYAKIYNYTKNIKPAPSPYYMLQKYYGNLTIQEYRSLLHNERLFLIVDKPLTKILPELHEDNDRFLINNKLIPSSGSTAAAEASSAPIRKKMQKKGGISLFPSS
jgi:hypothetical protein